MSSSEAIRAFPWKRRMPAALMIRWTPRRCTGAGQFHGALLLRPELSRPWVQGRFNLDRRITSEDRRTSELLI